jgi:hypothetical protein
VFFGEGSVLGSRAETLKASSASWPLPNGFAGMTRSMRHSSVEVMDRIQRPRTLA